ncbi:hypothetical protein VFPPC_00312 [Pochonia chlamydosporia 170]|uniref:Apple domain-containing protein n=1 Tax=Pochonia chlamydosporia 170 TaxID=1380566 RepID=A0A179G345_METCM|nr:hypothetical protein VFPPC_00312 [Pochonia chlamydosporia 170]OAQ72302.1 hypothetical protein VFPPC_00312 [Pochonia chlamydosporia 170]
MRWSTVTFAGLLATVHAAPRLLDQATQNVQNEPQEKAADAVANGLYARTHKWGNAKFAQHWNAQGTGAPMTMPTMAPGCPTASVVVSTTTVDVTVYVTPAANTTEPCPEETPAPTTSEPCPEETTTEPCPEETGKWNSTMPASTTEPCPETTGWNTTTPTTSEPCESTGWMNSTVPLTTGPKSTTVIHMTKNMTMTSEPCPEETPTTTEPCEETWTSTHATTRTVQVTPFTTASSTSCVIDTSMTPVTKSSMTSTPTAVQTPTQTICEHDKPTGSPRGDSSYCGIKGQPAGTYFIAEFIEERSGVAVTEEGCYQFCDSVMEDTKGCQSYRFYKNELGAPRCDLYGMTVSHVVRDLDNNQPGRWYDLSCGSPTGQKWHESMPQHEKMDAAAGAKSEKPGLLNLKLGPLSLGL